MTSDFTVHESFERFSEGLRKARDRAKELAKHNKSQDWKAVAVQLNVLLENGRELYKQGYMARQQALMLTDQWAENNKRKEEARGTVN